MTRYAFTAEDFHVERAVQAHDLFVYQIGESGLEVQLNGYHELGELKWINLALQEANRLFKHRSWVEIEEWDSEIDGPLYRVLIWRGCVPYIEDWRGSRGLCMDRIEEICQPGHAADFGWLKEDVVLNTED